MISVLSVGECKKSPENSLRSVDDSSLTVITSRSQVVALYVPSSSVLTGQLSSFDFVGEFDVKQVANVITEISRLNDDVKCYASVLIDGRTGYLLSQSILSSINVSGISLA